MRKPKRETRAEAIVSRDKLRELLKTADARFNRLSEHTIDLHDERARLARVLAFVCAKAETTISFTGAELAQLPDGARLGEDYDTETDTYNYACVRPRPIVETIPAAPEHTM